MTDYSQPDFYRFNEDSIKLVKHVLKRNSDVQNLLDLGAGCGVMGIELSRNLMPQILTMVEVQEDYLPHLRKNSEMFLPSGVEVELVQKSFSSWGPQIQYDLIVSNPPYYLPGHGEKNQDERKEIARSFVMDGWSVLMEKISKSLSDSGKAYLVLKNDQKILREMEKFTSGLRLNIETELSLMFVELSRLDEN